MRAAAAAVAAGALLLGGCSDSPGFDFPDRARIDVDTPTLRKMKAEAGVEDCRPGAVAGASDLPSVTLPCFGGGPDVDLSSLEGPLVVNIWAGWCGPCRKEMPLLEEFHQQYGDRVPIIGINRDDPQSEAAMELVQETGVTYPLLSDPQDDLLGAEPFNTLIPMPMFAFVAASGSVALYSPLEAVESMQDLLEIVERHTGEKL